MKTSPKIDHHQPDLKEAIYYLPPNMDERIVCCALKSVYPQDGYELALEWIFTTKKIPPSNFDKFWEDLQLNAYQEQNLDRYLKEQIYNLAEKSNWMPKALRKGTQAKRPPSKRKQNQLAEDLNASKKLEENLTLAREEHLPLKDQSYIPNRIVNFDGGCFKQPFLGKEEIPRSREEYARKLTKIVDCEVRVLEATEHIREKQGREPDELEVRYKVKLKNRKDKDVTAVITYEEMTTKTRFSTFLVRNGFVKFLGATKDFDRFHEFLIKEQPYPTVRKLSSWGEIKSGIFLFENGLFDTHQNKFFKADEKGIIPYGNKHLVCTEGSEQVRPPRLASISAETPRFLAEMFKLWESFNGSVNVRVTLGYAVACIFSREIVKRGMGFPMLFKFGQRGTGKSSSMDWFMALFGYPNGNRQSVSKQNTIKSVIRRMTLPKSFPFFLDDFRNSENNQNAPDLTSSFLNWYERIGTGMAAKTTDHTTIDTPMKACVVMTGNDKPIDPAAVSRLIILNYNRFLKQEQLGQVSEITRNLKQFPQFLRLLLENYSEVRQVFFKALAENQTYLAGEDFQGRTVNNWAIILAGLQCIEPVIPHLSVWFADFDGFRRNICDVIRREESQQETHNPLHEFLSTLDYYATQKQDPAIGAHSPRYALDHRHFRFRHNVESRTSDGSVYHGNALAIHLTKIWSVLQDNRASVTHRTTFPGILASLENSSYFLEKSVQVPLTKSIDTEKESNLRCYLLDVDELQTTGLVDELLEKAREYERDRVNRNY